MAKLDTLDPTQPPDTEVVAQGALRMREERTAIINSFDTEHYLTGEHNIPSGTTAARPGPGTNQPNRWYVNNDRGMVERTLANAWTVLHAVNIQHNLVAGAVPLIPTYSNLVTLNVNTPLFAAMAIYGSFVLQSTGVVSGISYRVRVDGIVQDPGVLNYIGQFTAGNSLPLMPLSIMAFTGGLGLAEGAHFVELQALVTLSDATLQCISNFVGVLIA